MELPYAMQQEFLVNLCNTGPIFMRNQLAVLHDAAVMSQPSAYTFPYRIWNRRMIAGLLKNAQVAATVSTFSASEFMRHWGIRARGIEIISESGEHILRKPPDVGILTRLDLTDQPYILAVGSQTANKNFQVVVQAVRALEDLKIKLVAVGGGSRRVYNSIPPTDSNVIAAGYVTDVELRALYENARCFVFPSLYEGFGLPPLEAMQCGCPVIVSRRASLPEVCADAALYCDPLDPADVAAQIRRLLTSRALREEMTEAGLVRAATFTWRRAADKLASLLADVGNAA